MHYDSGFGSMKLVLSLATMINVSMMVGLTQGDTAKQVLHQAHTMRQAAIEIKQNEAEILKMRQQMARANAEMDSDINTIP